MVRYKIYFDKAAVTDIRDIAGYIAKVLREPGTAGKTERRIYQECASLEYMPNRYPLIQDHDLAELGFRMTSAGNYLIFYTVDSSVKSVHIKRILNGHRNWKSLFRNPT